jgi:hypothetical protein
MSICVTHCEKNAAITRHEHVFLKAKTYNQWSGALHGSVTYLYRVKMNGINTTLIRKGQTELREISQHSRSPDSKSTHPNRLTTVFQLLYLDRFHSLTYLLHGAESFLRS